MKNHKKKTRQILILLIACFTALNFASCDKLEEIVPDLGLSMERVVQGLKKALNIGTDDASASLSATDGFYMDAAAKILLPEEAQVILEKKDNQLFQQLGLTNQIDTEIENVILSINRSAEDAAVGAKPIFTDAITNLSITDGFDILNGKVPGDDTSSLKSDSEFDSTAATTYLQNQTLESLTGLFSPKIDESLDKKIVSGVSANTAWNTLQKTYNDGVDKYNTVIDLQNQSFLGKRELKGFEFPSLDLPEGITLDMLNLDLGDPLDRVEVDLSDHCTSKALSAVFGKIKIKEKEIRRNPYEFTSELIQDVFGSVYQE